MCNSIKAKPHKNNTNPNEKLWKNCKISESPVILYKVQSGQMFHISHEMKILFLLDLVKFLGFFFSIQMKKRSYLYKDIKKNETNLVVTWITNKGKSRLLYIQS